MSFLWLSLLDMWSGKRTGTVTLPSPDLSGKVAIVTGGGDGIGFYTAKYLASLGAHVIITSRNLKKGQERAETIQKENHGKGKVEAMQMELSDHESIREFVEEFKKKKIPLNILVNNAGGAYSGHTKDGFEAIFSVNALGPFLLTRLLIDKLKESAPSRIVNVSSLALTVPKEINFEDLRKPTPTFASFTSYGVSKLFNSSLTVVLEEKLKGTGVTTYSLHPGMVSTNIWGAGEWGKWLLSWIFLTEEQGAQTTIFCATEPSLEKESGKYYEYLQEMPYKNELVYDENVQKEFWNKCSEWTGLPIDL